jgi:hypothetical protein
MPRQSTAHVLNALKGWPSQHAVDFSAPMSAAALAAVAPNPVFAGRCGQLNASKQFALGVTPDTGKIIMPMFFLQNSDDPDVSSDGGITGDASTDDPEGWARVGRNNMTALTAAGAFELETTEFDTDVSYEPNDALTADPNDDGVISKGTPYTDHIVGIVSRGKKKSGQLASGRDVLAFWPYCLPPSS